jgi:hypothetical protein
MIALRQWRARLVAVNDGRICREPLEVVIASGRKELTGCRRGFLRIKGNREVILSQKSAPEELVVILLLPGSAGVESRAELPVYSPK